MEAGFTEADLLWTPDYRETHDDVNRRVTSALDTIFHSDHEQCRLFFATVSLIDVNSKYRQSYLSPRMEVSLVDSYACVITAPGSFPQEVSIGDYHVLSEAEIKKTFSSWAGIIPVVVKASAVNGELHN